MFTVQGWTGTPHSRPDKWLGPPAGPGPDSRTGPPRCQYPEDHTGTSWLVQRAWPEKARKNTSWRHWLRDSPEPGEPTCITVSSNSSRRTYLGVSSDRFEAYSDSIWLRLALSPLPGRFCPAIAVLAGRAARRS